MNTTMIQFKLGSLLKLIEQNGEIVAPADERHDSFVEDAKAFLKK